MLGGRKFIVQSGWPERLAIVLWRKLQDRQASLVTTVNRKAKVFRKVCGPISNPRGQEITKSGKLVDGLSNPGNRLHPLGTRKAASQDEVGRKASGNGGGHIE
jgi:hypothetical protein